MSRMLKSVYGFALHHCRLDIWQLGKQNETLKLCWIGFLVPKLELTCVGMRYRATPSTLEEISSACPLRVDVVREPDNLHDENALAVICREKPWRKMKFGYISRQTAAELSPRIDRGKLTLGESWLTEVDPDSGTGEMLVKALKSHG